VAADGELDEGVFIKGSPTEGRCAAPSELASPARSPPLAATPATNPAASGGGGGGGSGDRSAGAGEAGGATQGVPPSLECVDPTSPLSSNETVTPSLFSPLPPSALQEGWFEASDEHGRVYYYNESGETTWEPPLAQPREGVGGEAGAAEEEEEEVDQEAVEQPPPSAVLPADVTGGDFGTDFGGDDGAFGGGSDGGGGGGAFDNPDEFTADGEFGGDAFGGEDSFGGGFDEAGGGLEARPRLPRRGVSSSPPQRTPSRTPSRCRRPTDSGTGLAPPSRSALAASRMA